MNLPDNREKILRQLEHYKRRAPFYNECRDVVAASLSLDTDQVTLVNANALACCNNYIGLNTPVDLGSKLSLQYNYIKHAGQWAVTISSQLQASTYINPVDGASLFVEEEFLAAGVQLNFLKAQLPVYDQRRDMFEPSLSIIDVMMFNDSTAINQMLNDCIIC